MYSKSKAIEITGGLSKPSKMPGPSYNLPAKACLTGSKLCKIKGSVCSGCYARKGRYLFGNVQKTLSKRLQVINDPRWVDAMVDLINASNTRYFRWHDSGDIQSLEHLTKIMEVCKKTPTVKHWLPTKEYAIIRQITTIPDNLTIRVSAPMIDSSFTFMGMNTSAVQKNKVLDGYHCEPVDGKCGECRECWNRKAKVVIYVKH